MMHLRREPGPECLTELTFDEWAAGELSAEQVAQLEQHVGGCATCTERKSVLDEERAAFLAAAPTLPRPAKPAKPKRQLGVLLGSGAAALALAAGVALFLRAAPDAGTRTKGGGASLGFFVKRGDHVAVGGDGERVRAGDALRFTVASDRPVHVAVLGLDARGVASVYYPTPGHDRTVGPGPAAPLDVAVELDDTPGEERLFGLFCAGAVSASDAKRELEQGGSLAPRPGCSVDVLRIVKERAP